ncbi:MAG: hybrid sensor histidine kinase/response regulator [Niabella sp.]
MMSTALYQEYSFGQTTLYRSLIFLILALLSAVSCCVYYFFHLIEPFYISAGYLLIVLIGAFIYLKHKRIYLGRLITFIATCILALLLSYYEGYDTHAIYFFLPAVMIIQILINKKGWKDQQSIVFYGIWFIFLFFTLMVTRGQGSVIKNNPEVKSVLRALNLTIIFLLGAFYSLFGLLLERWYIKNLLQKKQITEELKNKQMDMMAKLGHEIRTQATSINAASKMLMETELTNKQKPMIEILDYSANQMFYLIRDILDLRKIEKGILFLYAKPKNIYNIILNAKLPFVKKASERKLDLVINIDENIKDHWVMVDDIKLNQVLHNLLSNALKFTLEGSVLLKATLLYEDAKNLSIYFEISDTGVGIQEKNIRKIFESFWQEQPLEMPIYGGSGLGLTIASGIVTKMGSQLQMESEPGMGTKFYFSVTFKKIDMPALQPDNEKERLANLKGLQILVVDDNKTSLLFTKSLLTKAGMEVYCAENGLSAIEIFNKNQSVPIILLDLEMPELNGYMAIHKLKEINRKSKIVAFTASIPEQALSQKLSVLGFDDFISKPFTQNELLKIVGRNLEN